MATSRSRSQPIEFRQQEVGHVMERWRASESCSLIGVGSVGKSNLLQHLADPDVQTYYMKDVAQGKPFKAIIIDPSMLGPLPTSGADVEQIRCWAGYELMMHRLFLAFYPFESLSPEDARVFYDIYQALQDGTNPLYAYMGLRYLELGLELFTKRGTQIVFMFDEFEEMLRQLPVKFFLTLRGLRDGNKNRLSYLTFTRAPIPDIADSIGINPLDIEPFAELFNDNVYYVGPYNEVDGREMVKELMRRNNRAYDDYTINFLLWASGRYAGLLRSCFRALDLIGPLEPDTVMTKGDQIVRQLVSRRSVRIECKTIWTSLSPLERSILRAFASPDPRIDTSDWSVKQAFALLAQKKLVRIHENRVIVEPPVFFEFVANDPDADI